MSMQINRGLVVMVWLIYLWSWSVICQMNHVHTCNQLQAYISTVSNFHYFKLNTINIHIKKNRQLCQVLSFSEQKYKLKI